MTTKATYVRPALRDYGSLVEITEATGFTCDEDGGNKFTIHHTPSNPSGC